MSVRRRPCEDASLPHGFTYARRYLTGWKCDRHTPAAWAGRPEPQPGPGWPAGSYLNQSADQHEPPAEQEQSS